MKKKILVSIIAVVLVLATCLSLAACVPTQKQISSESSVAIGDNGYMTENKTYAMPKAMSFSQKGLDRSETGYVAVDVYATVYPENAPNKKVDWNVEWADAEHPGNVLEYVSVYPDDDGSANAVIVCYQPFDGEIIITVITREGKFADNCIVTFIGKPSDLLIEVEGLGEETGSFGTYTKLATGTTYNIYAEPVNAFGQVGADCNFTYSIKAYGSIVTKDNSVNTNTDAVTWVEGTEKTINLEDITKVSPWYNQMFDISMDGSVLTIKANCTPENYIVSQTRVSSSKIENDDTFLRFTNDNWYYEITITETNSGVSNSIKVRPVLSVTGVFMSMGEYQF